MKNLVPEKTPFIPLKNIKMLAVPPPPPPPSVLVGFMKYRFFTAFLCLILSSCGGSSGGGGGGNSTSSSKKAKAAKACTTPIPNGKGELPWNTKTKKYSTTCKVVSCNAGYVKNTGRNSCDIPEAGKYADKGVEKDCSPITGGFNTFLLNTGAVETATGCGFSCNAGFLKSGRACNFPRKGKYLDGSGIEQDCSGPGGTDGGFNEFLDNIKGVNSASGCNFSCKPNHVKSASGYTCTKGYPCSIDNGAGFKATSSSTTCQVVDCDAGYDSTQAPTTQCQETASGYYSLANNKGRTACPTPPHSSATTTTELSSADGCYTCDGGYLKNTARNTCDFPSKGTYVNAQGSESSCNPITTLQGGAIATWIGGAAADSAITCPFSCSAGFVKSGRACNIPGLGKYADNAGGEQSCNNPTGAAGGFDTFLPNTGAVDSATGCGFSCNAGFMKDSSARECNYPTPGTYVNNQGAESSCTDITRMPGFGSWVSGAATADDACPFSCSAGFVKSGKTCNIPHKGKYADNGVEKACSPITGGGFEDFTVNTEAVSTATGCGFFCNAGFVKSGRACNIPNQGKYADGAGDEQSCDTPTGESGGFNTFLPNTAAVDSAAGCKFSCNAGFVKIGRKCNYPTLGSYVNNQGNEASCNSNSIALQRAAISTWIVGAADDADTCPFSCTTGYVKSGRACNIPDLGKYADNVGREQDCDNPTGDTGGFNIFLPNSGAVSSATGCGFSCNAGFVKDSSARECNYPSSGNYVTARNTESPCNSITTEGTAVATRIVGAASTATTCPFSCTPGYVVDTAIPKCKYPTQGTYADAQGAEVGCTDISGITGFGSWLDGAATDADSCPFSCASGYTILGRMCNKAIPKMLALGTDSSRVLFDNGEVKAWGKVSTSPWRSHINEDLGSHTPQALVSGWFHQCIILKNAALNHGRLMCWGNNGNGRLGVGDNNLRTTPTDVTAVGNDNDGNPYTVKSVAAGGKHTCALLSNNTVVCWGDNGKGQIGGGSGANKTISGTVGGPLGSTTASRISAGWQHTCAVLTTDKPVKCWGSNAWGQTGGGTPSLGANKTATEIATGSRSSCAILNDGSVVCWGGLGSTNLGGKIATKIAVGSRYACGLLNDKTVKCWGRNNNAGQLGGGYASSDQVLRGTSGDPLGGQTAIKIASASYHTCAVMESDNSVKCWGANSDDDGIGFYGQIVGGVAMTGGTNGTGTSTGESQTLTASSTPTAIALEEDAGGKICKITLYDGSNTWIVKDYTTPLTYNSGGSTAITAVIDSLITEIGSSVNVLGTNVTLSKSGSDKIVATTDNAVLNGMSFIIYHDDNGGDCTGLHPSTPITLGGASGGDKAEGPWVISEDYSGSGDTTINLDSVHIDLGNTGLTKEEIADKIVAGVNGGSWAGKQYKDLPYTATKLEGSSDANDDCPANDFCVVFDRVFKGAEGNYGIPFGDRDYSY